MWHSPCALYAWRRSADAACPARRRTKRRRCWRSSGSGRCRFEHTPVWPPPGRRRNAASPAPGEAGLAGDGYSAPTPTTAPTDSWWPVPPSGRYLHTTCNISHSSLYLHTFCNISHSSLYLHTSCNISHSSLYLHTSYNLCVISFFGIRSTPVLPQEHVKDPGQSVCQKCRWQVTAKHACTLRVWLCMKWHGAWLYTERAEDGSSFMWHQPCQRCKYTASEDI